MILWQRRKGVNFISTLSGNDTKVPSLKNQNADTAIPETCRKRKLLTVLKVKIKLLKDQLEAAENELRALEAELHTEDSSIRSSRIIHLPEELLVDIFQLTLLDNHPRIRTLLLVSKRWNRVVMNMPSLWTTIQLVLRGPPLYDEMDAVEAYHNVCIQRSGGMLLNVSIEAFKVLLKDRKGNEDVQYHNRLCAVLINGGRDNGNRSEIMQDTRKRENNTARWKTFRLELPEWWEEADLLSAVFQSHAPNLTTIQIFDASPNECFLANFESFIGRTSVHSYSTNRESLAHYSKPRFAYLRSLDVTYEAFLTFLRLKQLEEMTSLQALVIRAVPQEYDPISFEKILLPRLVHITLDGPVPAFILAPLEIPKVKRFTILVSDTLHIPDGLNIEPEELILELALSKWPATPDPEAQGNFYELLILCQSAKTIKVPARAGIFVVDAIKNIPDSLGLSIEISNPRIVDGNSLVCDICIENDPSLFDKSQS